MTARMCHWTATHWRNAKSNFLLTAEFKNVTALIDWACLLILGSRKVGNYSYFSKGFPLLSLFLTLNMLLWTSSEQHGLLKKKSQLRVSSSYVIREMKPFSHEPWQSVFLLIKLYWNSGPWADLQISSFEMTLYCQLQCCFLFLLFHGMFFIF